GVLPDSCSLQDGRLTLADVAVASPFVNLTPMGDGGSCQLASQAPHLYSPLCKGMEPIAFVSPQRWLAMAAPPQGSGNRAGQPPGGRGRQAGRRPATANVKRGVRSSPIGAQLHRARARGKSLVLFLSECTSWRFGPISSVERSA